MSKTLPAIALNFAFSAAIALNGPADMENQIWRDLRGSCANHALPVLTGHNSRPALPDSTFPFCKAIQLFYQGYEKFILDTPGE
jgi:hypothetical protein